MKKTVVINVVGLSPSLISKNTPFLQKWSSDAKVVPVEPVIPAVTCTMQATYLTGRMPESHGIVGNGWYFKDECEIKFWRQSNKLVKADKIWDKARRLDPKFTCSNMFWWYNMYSTVDYSVTPRPMYLADGRKVPDCYSYPADLRDQLQERLGDFPLFDFWGPKTSIKSSRWIAEASKMTDERFDPTLTLIYLPHLDYNFQRYGKEHKSIPRDLKDIDKVCEDLIKYYEAKGAQVIVLSEYGITDVSHPVHINRELRRKGFIQVREERGLELLDAGASKAFAVADHQVAHVYVNDPSVSSQVRELIESLDGVEKVWDVNDKIQQQLNHSRAGDYIAIAGKDSWFTYYYWLEDDKAPDFARTIDIHRKPGYDPVELFLDASTVSVGYKLMKKNLGFRTVMDFIPLDAGLVKGSHGRVPDSTDDYPVVIVKDTELLPQATVHATDIHDLILSHLFPEVPPQLPESTEESNPE